MIVSFAPIGKTHLNYIFQFLGIVMVVESKIEVSECVLRHKKIYKEILRNLKQRFLIVNASRAVLINRGDLIKAFDYGRLGGVALGVFQVED